LADAEEAVTVEIPVLTGAPAGLTSEILIARRACNIP